MIVIGLILFYIFLPPINIQSPIFWIYTFLVLFTGLIVFSSTNYKKVSPTNDKISKVWLIILTLIFILFFLGLVSGSKIFRSKDYANILEPKIKTESFDNYKATMDSVPLLDKESAMLIANRKMGSLEDVVSQFEISDSEQITVRGESIRVSILDYAGFFKWLNYRNEGTPGYIRVDMKKQRAEIIKVDEKIKYTFGAYFSKNINRYLRFNYPTLMFKEPSLELDEDDHPYWIAPIKKYTISIFGGEDIAGVVIVDAVNGEMKRYNLEDAPTWIDNVYPSSLLMRQYDDYGSYQDGFLNARFGQRGVKVTTDGYNYIPQGDDNWIYTGVTSVVRDESNIGFLLMNKRTKETIYYPLAGAEEYSAMSSAEGVVQHLGYTSTFPLLLQIEDQPTYLVTLKDDGGLVKMYGMVNVEIYHIVATGTSLDETHNKYKELLIENGVNIPNSDNPIIVDDNAYTDNIKGVILDIKTAVKGGNTHFYIKIQGSDSYYELNINENAEVIILQIGDNVELEIMKSKGNIVPAILK